MTTMDRYSRLDLFGVKGRLGRLVYFLFSFIIPTSIFWIIAAIAGQLHQRGIISTQVTYGLIALALVAALVLLIMLTIQRSHDLNRSGWLSLLILLFPPLIGIFWLVPGSKGANNYHQPAPPLPIFPKIIAFLLFLGLLLPMVYLMQKYSVLHLLKQWIQTGIALIS